MVAALGVVMAAGCGGNGERRGARWSRRARSATAPTTSAIAAASGAPAAPPAKDGCQGVGKAVASARHNMAVVALPDGRVLFVGGGLHDMGDPRAEVDFEYDPKTNRRHPLPRGWSTRASCRARRSSRTAASSWWAA